MKKQIQIQLSKWLLGILFIFGILLLIGPIYYSFKSAIWLDPAIILTEMESISKGYIPYKSIHLNYPPLYFYIMVGLKKLFGIHYGNYNFYLVINYLFLFGSAVCIYIIGSHFSKKKLLSVFSAWLYVLVMLKLGANSVMFEVPSIFFGLLSCMLYLFLKNQYPVYFFIIGVIAVCSFLVKQFGAVFFALVIYLILCFSNRKKWQQILFFSLGYMIPILFVIIIFGWEFVESTLLNGYGTTTSALKGEDISFGNKISIIYDCSIQSTVHTFIITISAISLLPMLYEQKKWKEVFFCLCGYAGFCLQYYFCCTGAPHYRQYLAPFAILLIPAIAVLDFKKNHVAIFIFYMGLLLTMCIPIINGLKSSIKMLNPHYCEMGRVMQQEQANEICNYIEQGSTIWIANTEILDLYYFTNIPTPNLKQVGYSAGPWEITIESATLQVYSADYVLCCSEKTDDFDYYLKPLRPYIESFHCDTIDKNLLLYNMRKPLNDFNNKSLK